MAVAIMPGLFVAVISALRAPLIQEGGQVRLSAGLKLNGANRRRTGDVENVNGPSSDARGTNDCGHLVREVVHDPVPFGIEENPLLVAHVYDPCDVAFESIIVHAV